MKHLLILITAAALIAVATGCATSPAHQAEKLLTQSGFKALPAHTAAQQQQVNALPPGKVSLVRRKGQTYYVYPDAARNMLYVGNKAQYQAYQTAVQDKYLSQDARMVRDASASSALNEDSLEMSGAMPSLEQLWEGWPD